MPIRTDPGASPGLRTHSCALVYLTSSGYTALLGVVAARAWCRDRRLSGLALAGVLRCRLLGDRGDLPVLRLHRQHLALHAGSLHLVDEAVLEAEGGREVVRAADGLDGVPRL